MGPAALELVFQRQISYEKNDPDNEQKSWFQKTAVHRVHQWNAKLGCLLGRCSSRGTKIRVTGKEIVQEMSERLGLEACLGQMRGRGQKLNMQGDFRSHSEVSETLRWVHEGVSHSKMFLRILRRLSA